MPLYLTWQSCHVSASEGLEPNEGLMEFVKWIDANGIKKAAVTNAPRHADMPFHLVVPLSMFRATFRSCIADRACLLSPEDT